MSPVNRGFSTVECLIAVTVFSLGGLGAAGTAALALRLSARGSHAAQSARLAAESIELLHSQLRIGGQRCASVGSASRVGPSGEVARWVLTGVTGGMDLSIVTSYPTPSGQHTDSIHGFLRCH
jgi:Tfp pilus assembly protein PilV